MPERLFGRLLSLPKPGQRPGLAAGTAARSRLGMRRRGGATSAAAGRPAPGRRPGAQQAPLAGRRARGAGPYRALRRPPEKRFSLNSNSYRNPPAAPAY